jgi:hypothetical protein
MVFSRIVDMDADILERPVGYMLPAHHINTHAEAGDREDVALFRRVRISVVNEYHRTRRIWFERFRKVFGRDLMAGFDAVEEIDNLE